MHTAAPEDVLVTERLSLEPITLEMVEAVLRGDRGTVETLARARLPDEWPGASLIHQGFGAAIDAVRADPRKRLWGDRLFIARSGERRVLGSVIFHGFPDEDGVADVGYGVAVEAQRRGIATEGVRAAVRWALAQPGVHAVRATTFPWHVASLRVIERCGMQREGSREDDIWGELWVFSIARAVAGSHDAPAAVAAAVPTIIDG